MEWLVLVGMGVLFFLVFGLENCIKLFTDASVKKAEANAKAEEHRTERARLELERAQVERDRDRA